MEFVVLASFDHRMWEPCPTVPKLRQFEPKKPEWGGKNCHHCSQQTPTNEARKETI